MIPQAAFLRSAWRPSKKRRCCVLSGSLFLSRVYGFFLLHLISSALVSFHQDDALWFSIGICQHPPLFAPLSCSIMAYSFVLRTGTLLSFPLLVMIPPHTEKKSSCSVAVDYARRAKGISHSALPVVGCSQESVPAKLYKHIYPKFRIIIKNGIVCPHP